MDPARRIRRALTTVVLAFGLALISCARQPEVTQLPAPPPPDPVKQGEHLVRTSGCEHCHTPGGMYGLPDPDRRLAGSDLGWKGPWGVHYPSNLTPDMTSGIGQWSEDDIVAALRMAQLPNHTAIQGPMPWYHFVYFTEEDARDIAAYLKSIPPVPHRVPDRVPAGGKVGGPYVEIPPPPPWDAPRGSP